jgi:hypothetical protein
MALHEHVATILGCVLGIVWYDSCVVLLMHGSRDVLSEMCFGPCICPLDKLSSEHKCVWTGVSVLPLQGLLLCACCTE